MSWSSSGPRRARVGLGLIASLIFAVGSARAVPAPPDLVILLESADASPAATQSLRRIKDELAADRFDVVFATHDTATGAASPTWSAERGALIVLFGDRGRGAPSSA